MKKSSKTAKAVGILFIIATLGSVVGGSIIRSVIDSPDRLAGVALNEPKMVMGALITLVLAFSVVLIPALLFPILRKYDERLALGYFGIRILEALTPVIDVLGILMLISLSRDLAESANPNESYFRTMANLLLEMRDWAFILNPVIFGAGSVLFNYLLYKSKIIPRWLSGWGLIGALSVSLTGVMGLFGNFIIALALPIALQEMVFAVWLITRGFNSSKNKV